VWVGVVGVVGPGMLVPQTGWTTLTSSTGIKPWNRETLQFGVLMRMGKNSKRRPLIGRRNAPPVVAGDDSNADNRRTARKPSTAKMSEIALLRNLPVVAPSRAGKEPKRRCDGDRIYPSISHLDPENDRVRGEGWTGEVDDSYRLTVQFLLDRGSSLASSARSKD